MSDGERGQRLRVRHDGGALRPGPTLREGGTLAPQNMREAGLTPAMCRAARNAVGPSQVVLAEKAGVSRPAVQDFENKGRVRSPTRGRPDVRAASRKVAQSAVNTSAAAFTFSDGYASLAGP